MLGKRHVNILQKLSKTSFIFPTCFILVPCLLISLFVNNFDQISLQLSPQRTILKKKSERKKKKKTHEHNVSIVSMNLGS
jgi:hypothetical protein